jgi:hypothetical protein
MLTPEEIGDLIVRLRAEGKALEGDGFSHVGNVKGAVKRACVQLESLQLLLANPPTEEKAKVVESAPNPNCYGTNEHNIPTCECRRIFESFYAERSIKPRAEAVR